MINTAKLRAKKVWYNTLTVAGVRLDPSVSCKCRLHAVTIKLLVYNLSRRAPSETRRLILETNILRVSPVKSITR